MKKIALLLSALSILALASCDKSTPVAPTGTVLTLTANPSEIPLGGTSKVTVLARKENGTPVNPGTQVRISTTLGLLDLDVVETDDAGVAETTLRSDGRIGAAELIARSGSAESGAVSVTIGRQASSVSLQATPSTVPETGGEVDLLALVRDDQSQPLEGTSVNFQTSVGTLRSAGSFQTTNSRGEVRDKLTISEDDLLVVPGDDFMVMVEASGSGGAVQSDEATITIQRAPVASFTFTANLAQLTVSFMDTSTGRPREWMWDFGDGSAISTEQNPTHQYAAEGDYTVRLTVRNLISPPEGSSTSQVVRLRNN